MARNAFENNDPKVTQEEALELGDKVHSLLPPLAEGYHYDLTQLTNGRSAVVVEKDGQVSPEEQEKLDRFGRHQI